MISKVLGIKYDTFYHWVKDCLIRMDSEAVQRDLHGHDLLDRDDRGRELTVFVPIFSPSDIGEHMAIDEKYIKEEFFTVLTNSQTGRIAFMCRSVEYTTLVLALIKFGSETLCKVKTVTRDLSPTFEAVCRTIFPKARQTADKFHVIALGYQDLQSYRVSLKHQAESLEKEVSASHTKRYERNLQKEEGRRQKMTKRHAPIRLPNGETLPELLHRSRYLLYKTREEWTPGQRIRAGHLLRYFPELMQTHEMMCEFRKWYAPREWDDVACKTTELFRWLKEAFELQDSPLESFCSMLLNNMGYVVGYFDGHFTNAISESTNSKIQMAAIKNRGSRDIDFFCYRISHFLQPHITSNLN